MHFFALKMQGRAKCLMQAADLLQALQDIVMLPATQGILLRVRCTWRPVSYWAVASSAPGLCAVLGTTEASRRPRIYFNPTGGRKGIWGDSVDIDHKEFPEEWFEGLPEKMFRARKYDIQTNRYGVRARMHLIAQADLAAAAACGCWLFSVTAAGRSLNS